MSLLRLSDLAVTLRNRSILQKVSLDVGPGEFIGLIGANGAGKTTLMRAAMGLVPFAGDSSLAAMDRRARAKAASWLPQEREVAWNVDVESLVTLGRIPHLAPGQSLSAQDRDAVERAIGRMGLEPFRARVVRRLSGGEQARVLIARVLAQETPLVLADEPTSGLDPAHQISTMRTFRDLADEGRAMLVSIHDLGLAARHCTRLVLLGGGRIVADGAPLQVLTPENLRAHFQITAYLEDRPGGLVFQPMDVVR